MCVITKSKLLHEWGVGVLFIFGERQQVNPKHKHYSAPSHGEGCSAALTNERKSCLIYLNRAVALVAARRPGSSLRIGGHYDCCAGGYDFALTGGDTGARRTLGTPLFTL
jgi:hypothetical protein